jgi:hypothetical protein
LEPPIATSEDAAKELLPKAKPAPKPVAENATVNGATVKDSAGADTKIAANAKTSNKPSKPAAAKPASAKPDQDTTSKIKKRVIVIEGDEPLYMIQLAAFRNAEKATEMAKILSQKHKTRLQDADLETMSVDTGSNGIFYRIVSAPLPRPDADKICGVLRRSGQDCFLRKYTAPSP